METKKKVKKILFITWVTILSIVFVASLAFGIISAFIDGARESVEAWYFDTFEEEINLLKKSMTWLIISSILLVFTLSFKDFKKKYVD